MFRVFWGVFRVLGGVPGFLGAPGCSGMFRCSSVPGSTKADRVLCQLVMFLTVFFHWMYKMKQLLSRVFCYSWLVCLLGFWLRNASLVKIG